MKLPIHFIHIPKNAGVSIQQLCGSIIRYHSHMTNVFYSNIPNQLIIIRDPIDRFQSAIRYVLQKWSNQPHIQQLINHKIDTPDKWIQCIIHKTKPYYNLIMKEILNNVNQSLDFNYKLKYKWTYASQLSWINNPRYVIIYDNLQDEWTQFTKHYKLNLPSLPTINSTKKQHNQHLSQDSIDFLQKIYKKDIEAYKYFKSLSINKRLLY